ncbi:NACHT domain-containing protein [Streptomyces diastatochromogenes]|uniref:caspase, EACC1-associated type n=1 Tax=Streptomyces diastatochromogenes TaxID=42236 RepID=UPI00364D64C2
MTVPDPTGSRAVLLGTYADCEGLRLDALPAVERNLTELRRLLTDGTVWALPDEHCTFLPQPGRPHEVLSHIEHAAAEATDTLLVYYAGHGLLVGRRQELYLALPGTAWGDECLRFDSVRTRIREAGRRARRTVVILDCCYSGRALAGEMGPAGGPERLPADLEQRIAAKSDIDGACVLTASAATRRALAPEGEEFTAFTAELVSVLRDGVPGGIEFLDMTTIYGAVESRLAQRPGLPKPQFGTRGQGGRIVLTRNRAYQPGAPPPQLPLPPTSTRRPAPAERQVPPRLAGYLEAAARAAESTAYTTPMSRRLDDDRQPDLSQVYVRARAWAWDQETEPGAGTASPPLHDHAPEREAAAGERVSAEEVFTLPDDVLLVGAPGSGKSSLLRTGVITLARRWRGPGHPTWVPLLLHASDLTASLPWHEVFATGVRTRLGRAAQDSWSADFFRNLPASGSRLLVLVDGLDEIVDAGTRRKVLSALQEWRAQDPESARYRFVVATRPLARHGVSAPTGLRLRRFDLLPLDGAELSALALRWFETLGLAEPGKAAESFLAELDRAGMTELAHSPLLATMLCRLFALDRDRPLPPGRHAIYQSFVGLLHDVHYPGDEPRGQAQIDAVKRTYGAATGEAATDVLGSSFSLVERLALARHDGDTRPVVDLVSEWTSSKPPEHLAHTPDAWPSILREILRQTGLLVQRGDDFDFVHQTFAEYLAACQIAADAGRRTRVLRPVLALGGRRLTKVKQPPLTSLMRFLVPACLAMPGVDKKLRTALRKGAAHYSGARFIAYLRADRTPLEEETVDTAAATLHREAVRGSEEFARLDAARALAVMRHARAGDALAAIATSTDLKRSTRIPAARTLQRLHDDRGSAALASLAADAAQQDSDRLWAAQTLAEANAPQSGEVLFALATDHTLRDSYRTLAARALAESGDALGREILFAIAMYRHTTSFMATNAAHDLAMLGDPRGAEVLLVLADDVGLAGDRRVLAARVLASLDDPRGLDALRRLAVDDTVEQSARERATAHLSPAGAGYPKGVEDAYFGMRRSLRLMLDSYRRVALEPDEELDDLREEEDESAYGPDRWSEERPAFTRFVTRRSKVIAALGLFLLLPVPVVPGLAGAAFTELRTGGASVWTLASFGLLDLTATVLAAGALLALGVVTVTMPFDSDDSYEEGPETVYFGGALICLAVALVALVLGLFAPGWLGPVGSAGASLGKALAPAAPHSWMLILALVVVAGLAWGVTTVRGRSTRGGSPTPGADEDEEARYFRAELLVSLDRRAEAETEYRHRIADSARSNGPRHPVTLEGRGLLADLHHLNGDLAEAEDEYRGVLSLLTGTMPENDPLNLSVRSRLGSVLHALGRLDEAETEHRAVFDALELLLGPTHPATLAERDRLVEILLVQGRYLDVRTLLIQPELPDPPPPGDVGAG